MQSHRNYYWAIAQRPVSTEYPYALPHPDSRYVHLRWEQKQGIGIHRITTQHLLYVSPYGHTEQLTDSGLRSMVSNFLHEMAELKLLQRLGFKGYHLTQAAVVTPEILRRSDHQVVAGIVWRDVLGASVEVESFHDLHRRAKEATAMEKLYELGTIDALWKDDQWNVMIQAGPYTADNRKYPPVPPTYRNMYRLHAGISAGKGSIAMRVPPDSERIYTFAGDIPLVLNTPRGNKLYTTPTVDNFDECWLYAMAVGEGHAQFYFTDFRNHDEIDELSRVGIKSLLMSNPNAGFNPERLEFVRIIYDRGEPTVMLESGLLVNL